MIMVAVVVEVEVGFMGGRVYERRCRKYGV